MKTAVDKFAMSSAKEIFTRERKDHFRDIDDVPSRVASRKTNNTWFNVSRSNYSWSYIRNFLKSRIGQRWDDVYSEICHAIRDGRRRHVIDEALDIAVEKHPVFEGKKVYGRHYGNFELHNGSYYIDRDGLLRMVTNNPGYKWRPRVDTNMVKSDDPDIFYGRIEGIWYKFKLVDWSGKRPMFVHDDYLNESLYYRFDKSRLLAKYGVTKYAVKVKQLNKKEIKKLNLRAA